MSYRSLVVGSSLSVLFIGHAVACNTLPPEVENPTTTDDQTTDGSTGGNPTTDGPTTTEPEPSTDSADSGSDDGLGTSTSDGPGPQTDSSSDSGTMCADPMTQCGDDCVDTTANAEHCGDCDNSCDGTNGSAMCIDSGCVLECDEGFDDCDRAPANGCEVDLATDPSNCGGCGQRGVEVCDSLDTDCDTVVDDGCPGAVDVSPTDFGLHGQFGNIAGGVAFTDECPAGSAIVGMSGNVGGNIDRLRFDCAVIELSINDTIIPHEYSLTAGMVTTLPTHGSNFTFPFTESCPPDQFAIGIGGETSEGGLHDLTLHCAPLLVGGDIGAFTVLHGPTTSLTVNGAASGTPFTDTLPSPRVMTSVRGRSGAWVDAIGLGESDVALLLNG